MRATHLSALETMASLQSALDSETLGSMLPPSLRALLQQAVTEASRPPAVQEVGVEV